MLKTKKGIETQVLFWIIVGVMIMLIALFIISGLSGFMGEAGINIKNLMRFGA
jgi:hypothetical protein